MAGDGVARDGAVAELVEVAEALGATVFHEPMYDAVGFPATHPLSAGMLTPVDTEIRRAFADHDVVFLVGSHAFSAHYYTPARPIPEGVTVLQLDADAAELGRNHAVALGLHGGIRATLRELAPALRGSTPRRRPSGWPRRRTGRGARSAGPTPRPPPRRWWRRCPRGRSCSRRRSPPACSYARRSPPSRPGSFHHSVGGALGWGIGGSIGLKLARPEAPVVAVLGDGVSMYAIQGLWSAARYEVPVVIAVLNNREYRACKQGVDRVVEGEHAGRFVGMDLAPPAIDFVALAESLGVRGLRAEGPDAIAGAMAEAFGSGAPALVEIPIAGMEARGAGMEEEHVVIES